MTHFLFSRGRRWNGKAFGDDKRGINRFVTKSKSKEELDHTFDCQIEKSSLQSDQESLVLRYKNYQTLRSGGWTSLLWKSMVDEIRLIDCLNGECVLIGMGSLGWSGGTYNGSRKCDSNFASQHDALLKFSQCFPSQAFCLYRPAGTPK